MFDPLLMITFLLGGLAHIFATMAEDSKKAGRRLNFMEVANRHPYQLPLSLVFSIAAYVFLFEANQLNAVAAFSASYMGDSIVKKFMTQRAAEFKKSFEDSKEIKKG